MSTQVSTSFWHDTVAYAKQMKQFTGQDWLVYVMWVGLMLGLVFSTAGFVLVGHYNGVTYPGYVWNIPIGTLIFVGAIAFDTIGHRTAYKEVLKQGEELVHHITIFAGIASCVVLCLGYHAPEFWYFPALSLVALTVLYSIIDEGLHWHRYLNMHSDRVEMWSHFFIFLGHTIFILAWFHWFSEGYPGVAETLAAMEKIGLM